MTDPRAPSWPRRGLLLAGASLLAGCALPLPDKPVRAEPWDLGPLPALRDARPVRSLPLALNAVQAPSAIDSTRILYRLLYAGSDRQLQPYSRARWLMAPPQLFEQRLRAVLAGTYPLVDSGTGLERVQLQVDLEEFAQLFATPQASEGIVRIRALAVAPAQGRVLGQRTLVARRPAPTPDAAGGVEALAEASDQVIAQLLAWLDELAQQLQ
ncbi:MAG: ABC-type transport auxiliary lipoprotein family protein [Ottowia sp.]|nr:ABC-type transport auxiliary lipoprotein family protein [Ottowia sp.]